jgi:hypothetical protein
VTGAWVGDSTTTTDPAMKAGIEGRAVSP